MQEFYLIDSHAHLTVKDYGSELGAVIERATEAGVGKIISIGTSLTDSKEAIELAGSREEIWATVGIHPNDDTEITVEKIDWELFEAYARSPKVVGIGECGLDYSRFPELTTTEREQERRRQRQLFQRQGEMASTLGLPLIVHIRDAYDDVIDEFSALFRDGRGVFHCFSGDTPYLNFVLALPNFYILSPETLPSRRRRRLENWLNLSPWGNS
jgi:TatD DNase family protein